jgi:aryl-alcohol dehydrogenase-like predicted oxidoreductase
LDRDDQHRDMTHDAPRLPDNTLTLTRGAWIPLLGFGTWQINGQDAVRATSAALESGYRHLDTATVDGNEGEIGRALVDSGVSRDASTRRTVPSSPGPRVSGAVRRQEIGQVVADRLN